MIIIVLVVDLNWSKKNYQNARAVTKMFQSGQTFADIVATNSKRDKMKIIDINNKIKLKHHKGLTLKRWSKFRFCEQMANVDAEVGRTISWCKKDSKLSQLAFERALELLNLTITDPKTSQRTLPH